MDLRSRFCAFGLVTAPPFVRRWVLRGGSLVILSMTKHVQGVSLLFLEEIFIFSRLRLDDDGFDGRESYWPISKTWDYRGSARREKISG